MKKWMASIVVLLLGMNAQAGLPEVDLLEGISPGPDGKIDVLTVFAHQDDETLAGGSLIQMKQDPRVRLHLMCLTLGDKTPAQDRLGIGPEYMGRIRAGELRSAATVYGAEEVIQLDYHDYGLSDVPPERLVAEILAVMERSGAEVVITFDPGGTTAHPDHMRCSQVATAAFKQGSAQALYYVTMSPRLYDLPYRFVGPRNDPDSEPIKPEMRVDIRAQKKLKRMAMYEHASQHQFTSIGLLMEIVRHFNYEYFVRAEAR
jgi:LmbE family N-acetylglucosaminyl deacetylase